MSSVDPAGERPSVDARSGRVPAVAPASADRLAAFLADHRRLFVLTGAGVSTASGIPDYRDADGAWKRRQPIRYRQFVGSEAVRRRYWARSLLGWRRVAEALPNPAHHALARLEAGGRLGCLVTQNVDGLHQRAGSRHVVDLHGRLDRVECMGCRITFHRHALQEELVRLNPGFTDLPAVTAPDGDADLEGADYGTFRVPACPSCGGVLKPAFVFFGEPVPKGRTRRAFAALEAADGVLVVGSSLMVWSGYRFARTAARRGLPLALVNLGRTRADDLATLKLEACCGALLADAVARLG